MNHQERNERNTRIGGVLCVTGSLLLTWTQYGVEGVGVLLILGGWVVIGLCYLSRKKDGGDT